MWALSFLCAKSRKRTGLDMGFVCIECGNKHGNPAPDQVSTMHIGHCVICKRSNVAVTEARDYRISGARLDELAGVENGRLEP